MDRDFREEAQELLTAASDLDDKKAFVLSQEQEMEEYKTKFVAELIAAIDELRKQYTAEKLQNKQLIELNDELKVRITELENQMSSQQTPPSSSRYANTLSADDDTPDVINVDTRVSAINSSAKRKLF